MIDDSGSDYIDHDNDYCIYGHDYNDNQYDNDNNDDDDDDDDNDNDDDDNDDDILYVVILGNKVPEIDRTFPESAQLNERSIMRHYQRFIY